MNHIDHDRLAWRKSSRSNANTACVEVTLDGWFVLIRDSNQLIGSTQNVVATKQQEWTAFLDEVRTM